ncbi:MAG: FtsQ-type POTRA domain-containing protein [Anaerolineales bacterium]|nr:FtsQ-type POTRA domain-containing protein [Anaerolineales bacterium]
MAASQRDPKRSDMVRARRVSRKPRKKALNGKQRNSNASRNMPPMVTRTNTTTNYVRSNGRKAKDRRGRSNVKETSRRYNVALNTQGAELRLPAIPVVKVGWRIISGFMVILTLFAIYYLWTSPAMQVQSIELVGVERISTEQISDALQVVGSPIFTVDRTQVIQILQENYWELVDASVSVGFPARIVVEAGERQPVLLWKDHQTDYEVWVDLNGVSFPKRFEMENLVTVVAMEPPPPLWATEEPEEGEAAPDAEATEEALDPETALLKEHQLITPQMVAAILAVGKRAPADTMLVYDPEHGLGWVDPEENWQVYFGSSPDNMDIKLKVYAAIVEELKAKNIQPVLINLEHLHAPFYRLNR